MKIKLINRIIHYINLLSNKYINLLNCWLLLIIKQLDTIVAACF